MKVTNSYGCTATASTVVSVANTSGCNKEESAFTTNEPDLRVYPNPNDGLFILEMNFAEAVTMPVDIQITNLLGQSVYLNRTAAIDGNLKLEIKLDDTVTPGTYFIHMITAEQEFNRQFIFQR